MNRSAKGVEDEFASDKAGAALLPEPLLQSTLDALTMPVALLDETGCVIGINAAWRHVAGLTGLDAGIGDNYLKICDTAMRHAADARPLHEVLTATFNGRHKTFERVWRHPSATGPRDFRVRIKRLSHYVPARFLVS